MEVEFKLEELEELLFVMELEMAEGEDDCAAFAFDVDEEEFNETEEDDDTSPIMVLLTAAAVLMMVLVLLVELELIDNSDPLAKLQLLLLDVVLSSAATEAVAFACSLASSFRFLAAGGSTELSINSVLDIGWHQQRF